MPLSGGREQDRMDSSRTTAYLVLMDMETKGSWSNLTLNHRIAEKRPDSPAFVRELVYGVLERKITLDYFLGLLAKNGIRSLGKQERTILRMGLYQIRCMDSVPEYAAVSESVALARRYCKSRAGLVNAILRAYLKRGDTLRMPDRDADETEYLSVKYSYAPWLIRKWRTFYSAEFTERLLEAGNQRPPVSIRVNRLKTGREELAEKLRAGGFETEESRLCENALLVKGSRLLETESYRNGLFTPQDESSMLAVSALGAGPGEFVIDTCAAPGGKTTAIAERMGNTGRILACDLYEKRLGLVDRQARRLGLTNIETKAADAAEADPALAGKADRVLVDAPCSGLGVIRRKPEIKYREEAGIDELPMLQRRILQASSTYVRPGGTLLYSTCTINPEENGNVADAFLKENPSFEQISSRQLLPHEDGTDGFFICAMKRVK